jgi:hypothetical protein
MNTFVFFAFTINVFGIFLILWIDKEGPLLQILFPSIF